MSRRPAAFLLALAATLAALALGEAALRALGLPASDACWRVAEPFWQPEPDPELGWLYRPGAEVAGASINARGMRGPVLPPAKVAAVERLLFVGDSTCFGIWVALEDTFAARAAALLAGDGRRVEYEIGALPGYSAFHSAVVTRRLLAQRPDVVVLYVGAHNDHSRARYYADDEIPARLARRAAAWHDVRLLRLAEAAQDALYRHALRKLRSDAAAARVPPDAFAAHVRDMVRRAHAAGAVALVVAPPYSARQLADHPILPLYRDALRAVAAEEQAAFLDLQPRFAAAGGDALFLPDAVHFTAAGHATAAHAIATTLSRTGPGSFRQLSR